MWLGKLFGMVPLLFIFFERRKKRGGRKVKSFWRETVKYRVDFFQCQCQYWNFPLEEERRGWVVCDEDRKA